MHYFEAYGCPPEKMVVGLAPWGRTYSLTKFEQNSLGSPVDGPSEEKLFTKTKGFISYYEVISLSMNALNAQTDLDHH